MLNSTTLSPKTQHRTTCLSQSSLTVIRNRGPPLPSPCEMDSDSGEVRKPAPKPLQSSNPKTQYLILYNFVSALLWLVVLGRVLLLVPLVGFGRIYPGVGNFAKWTQSLALLEVLHAASGKCHFCILPMPTPTLPIALQMMMVSHGGWRLPHGSAFFCASVGKGFGVWPISLYLSK
jgi:hypothetical protein